MSTKITKAKVSVKPRKPLTARSGGAKSGQAAKPKQKLTPAQKLDAFGEDRLFEKIAECEYYHDIAQEIGVSRHALMNWLGNHEGMYARAKEARADKLAEDIIGIADEESATTKSMGEGEVGVVFDSTAVARNRLRVDARKWLASKMLPKKYGDKLQVGGAADLPPIQQDTTITADEAYRRMLNG